MILVTRPCDTQNFYREVSMLSGQKKAEISRKLLKHLMREKLSGMANYRRDLGNAAKMINERVDDLQAFLKEIYGEIFEEIMEENFSSKKVE
ncbi:MAG: hypothetical protein Q7S84_04570 [bacterium]|nr:hypothetical protein [bacterium]